MAAMKYRIGVCDRWFEVEKTGPNRVTIDGTDMVCDVVDGHLLQNGRSIRFAVSRNENGQPATVTIAGQTFPILVEDPRKKQRNGSRRSDRSARSNGEVCAPMNGQVVKILHAAGEPVKKGDVVLVLEAMKMENEVTAPVTGRLEVVNVTLGATVSPGAPLYTITPFEADAAPG